MTIMFVIYLILKIYNFLHIKMTLFDSDDKKFILNTALGILIGLIAFLLLVVIVIYIWLRFLTKSPGIKNNNDDNDETIDDLEDLFDDV